MTAEAHNLLRRARAEYMTSEPVSIAEPFLWIAPLVFGVRKAEIFLSLYQYARIIDDTVDSGKDPVKTKQTLREDLQALSHIVQGTALDSLLPISQMDDEFIYRRRLLYEGLNKINPERRIEVAEYLRQAVEGSYWDNLAIMYGRPIPDDYKLRRDNRAVLVYFEALSRVFFNKPFVEKEHKSKIEEFFQWVLRFDGLDDIVTDLEHGIWTFTRKSLNDSGVKLVLGEVVGNEIGDFYRTQRDLLVQESKTILPNIYLCNLPLIAKAGLHARLLQQAHRIFKTEWPKGKRVVFGKARGIE